MSALTFSIYLASSPIVLGVNILMMALLLSCTFACLMRSWFAFLIFLIYVGGILVLFAYFLALGPNQYSTPVFRIPVIILSVFILYFIY